MRTCNSEKWMETIQPEILDFEPEILGPKHCPVNHSRILTGFKEQLTARHINITIEKGMLSPDKARFIYVADINTGMAADYTYTIGFINYNDKTRAFTGLYGEKVFVCSNQMFHGTAVETKKRHTSSIIEVLTGKIEIIVDSFTRFVEGRQNEISQLKSTAFDDNRVGNVILNAIRNQTLGMANIGRIVEEWDSPAHDEFKERNAWSFQNAVTEVLKRVENPLEKVRASEEFRGFIRKELAA
jgi:hypothetical protein